LGETGFFISTSPFSLFFSLLSKALSSLSSRTTNTNQETDGFHDGREGFRRRLAGTATPPRRNPNLYFFVVFSVSIPSYFLLLFSVFFDFFLKLFLSLFSLMDSKFASKMGTKGLYLYKEKKSIPLGVLDRFRSRFDFVMFRTARFCRS